MADETPTPSGSQEPAKIQIRSNGNGKPTEPRTVQLKRPPDKKATSRIELSEAEPPAAAPKPGEPVSVRQVLAQAQGGTAKHQTSRISLDAAEAPRPGEVVDAAKDATVRVDLTGVTGAAAAVTGAPPVPAASASAVVADAQKNRTARIRIEEEPPADTDRSATARITLEGAEVAEPPKAAPQAPRTVRLQRPAAAPKTVVLTRPETAPKTVVMSRPAEEPPAAPKTVVLKKPEPEDLEATKGATAKITVPEGAVSESGPVTQRKTIRIKRAEGGGPPSSAKTLSIARPAAQAATAAAVPPELQEIVADVGDEPGPLYSVLALVAVLVVAALLYVLAAQTVAPNLPFPGKIL